MALGGSEEWKSVDQLLSDLFEDPGISSLINASTESSTNNWRPWSSLDVPESSTCISHALNHQSSSETAWAPTYTDCSPMSETSPTEPICLQYPSSLPLPTLTRLPSRVLDSPTSPLNAPQYRWHAYNGPSKPANHTPPTPPTTPVSHTATPQILKSPMSPYAKYPGPHGTHFQLDYRHLTDVEVTLRANVHDVFLHGKRGAVRSISANYTATVYVYDSFQEVRIPCSYLQPVTPSSFDRVKVLAGPLKGTVGVLISATGENGILQCQDGPQQLCQVSIQHIGRYIPNTKIVSPLHPLVPVSTHPPVYQQAIQHLRCPPAGTVTNAMSGGHYSHGRCHPSDFLLLSPARTVYPTKPPVVSYNSARGTITSPVFAATKATYYKEQYKNLIKSVQGQSGTGIKTTSVATPMSTWELLQEVMKKPSPVFNLSRLDEASDIKTSSVRVSLVCPLSQRRMTYPCRGTHCGHLQCFDAEAYIEFSRNQKTKAKVKKLGGRVQHVADKRWTCPICHKFTPSTHLYIDRTVLKIVRETSSLEVEFDRSGSWKLVDEKPSGKDVIDLTMDDADDDH